MADLATVDPSISQALKSVYDPCCREKDISVVDMGLLHRGWIDGRAARVEILLTSGWCPFASSVLTDIETALCALPNVDSAQVDIVWDEVWGPHRLADSARAVLRFLPDPNTVADRTTVLNRTTEYLEKGEPS
jgi:metal-sulfur cluster biosynthetic enzyme